MEGKKDYASAMSWFQKAADQGYALAYSAIGDLYAQGYGVGQDKGKALDYYKKAATAGDADACLHLGQMYEQGKDVKADPAQAARLVQEGRGSRQRRMCRRPETPQRSESIGRYRGVRKGLFLKADILTLLSLLYS